MRIWFSCALWMVFAAALLRAETIDRIVATVNGRPVMESDLAEQLRLEELMAAKPLAILSAAEQRSALERLVDQLLLEEQMDAVKFQRPTANELNQRMQEIRQQLAPDDRSWQQLISRYGLSEADLSEHIALQMRTLRFVDVRFRPAIRIDSHAVETYYREQLLPKMKEAGTDPVPLKQVQAQIQEILAQQQTSELLENWLKVLRAQTEIRLPAPVGAAAAIHPIQQAAEVR
jgi:parvulin-like peptidyl-prolyl isomerase